MTVSAYPEEVLFSSQEEADTRIVPHCLNISTSLPESGSIIVRSPDTDVLVLLTKYCKEIKNKILFDTGMGNKRRILCVNDIVQNKGKDVCSILPALHCFTGCDTTSTFVRRGKNAPPKLVEKNHQCIPILARIGQERQCSESLINDMEACTCAIYGGTIYSNVNKLRYDIFLRKYSSSSGSIVINVSDGTDMSLLPPCRSALEMHIRRVNYQVFIWVHAHENSPEIQTIQDSGWKLSRGDIEYQWTKEKLIVPQQLVEILCSQNPDMDDDQQDESIVDEGVEMTNMLDEVFENESDEED